MNLPDETIHLAEVKRLAEEARRPRDGADHPTPIDLPKTGEPGGAPAGVAAPIYMGKDHEVIPERYIIHFSFVQCRNCGHATRESEFFALSYLRSRVNGTRVRHLTKCPAPMFNLPVEKILTGCSTVPFCQACDVIDLSHLPPPPEGAPTIRTLSEPTLRGHVARASTPPKPKAAPRMENTPKPPKKATLDDLI